MYLWPVVSPSTHLVSAAKISKLKEKIDFVKLKREILRDNIQSSIPQGISCSINIFVSLYPSSIMAAFVT